MIPVKENKEIEKKRPMDSERGWISNLFVVGFFHFILILGILISLHYLFHKEQQAFVALYSFLALFTMLIVCWNCFIEKDFLNQIGINWKNLKKSLLINIILTLTILPIFPASNLTDPLKQTLPFIFLALISSLFEAIYIYGWLQKKLSAATGFTRSLLLTAFFYTIYHIGYYGFSKKGLDMFFLSFGLYMLVGIANAGIVRYTGSIFSIWPFSLTLTTIYDYMRIKLPVPKQTHSISVIAILMFVGMTVMIILDSKRNKVAIFGLNTTINFKLVMKHFFSNFQYYWREYRNIFLFLLPLFLIGLFIRFVINDPVEGVELLPPVMAQGFCLKRSLMNEITLKLGFSFYFLVPLYCMFLWLKKASIDSSNLSLTQGSALNSQQFAKIKLVSKALFTMLITLLLVILLFFCILGILFYQRYIPTGAELIRFFVVACAILIYTLLNFSIFGIITHAVRNRVWAWFVSFIVFIFVYNWWMIYPLFSQFQVVGLPAAGDPYTISNWMTSVWQRVAPLYGFVPQYNYYLTLSVTYLKNAFDRTWMIPSFLNLLYYAISFFLLALTYSRQMKPIDDSLKISDKNQT